MFHIERRSRNTLIIIIKLSIFAILTGFFFFFFALHLYLSYIISHAKFGLLRAILQQNDCTRESLPVTTRP